MTGVKTATRGVMEMAVTATVIAVTGMVIAVTGIAATLSNREAIILASREK